VRPRDRLAPPTAPAPVIGGRAGAFLRAQEQLLASSAISAGLGRIRARSAPSRLSGEARRFLRLLLLWLGGSSPHRISSVRNELRGGAFAASSPKEREQVFQLWRRVLPPLLAGAGHTAEARRVERALERMEGAVADEGAAVDRDRLDVVVVGASAGGLGALTTVVEGLDAWLPATLLVVLHVSANSPGLVPTLLARHSGLDIAWAVDGGAMHLGHAFVAPPGRHLVAGADAMHMLEGPPVHFVRPSADVLFESAAASFGAHVISLVLSGTGADGATGTRAIREHGGLTLAQAPATAEFSGMPAAAIATGAVDRVVASGRLGEFLHRAVVEGRTRACGDGKGAKRGGSGGDRTA
jgi:two-component system, chemotaxis family, protein-glutamate methylesterase/glutaminase